MVEKSNYLPMLNNQRKGLNKLMEPDAPAPYGMIGTCNALLQVFKMIRKVAATEVPVLITGASGTGKEMVAKAIHKNSLFSKGAFVAVNCGAIPRELLESELFGHEKGSFTGAHRTSMGMLERADGGTLLLDEVGELPLELQVKLLRFLQDYSFERVGGRRVIKVRLRVISATNGDLKAMIASNKFREDLYYRLDVVNIHLPSLKDRGNDHLILADFFLKNYTAQMGKEIQGFSPEALGALRTHHWPGNVREMLNRIRRAAVMVEGPWVTAENLGLLQKESFTESFVDGLGLKEAKAKFEAELLVAALEKYQGNVNLVAKALKINRSVAYHLISKYKLKQKS
jgi:two-component system NtrC family response regulator